VTIKGSGPTPFAPLPLIASLPALPPFSPGNTPILVRGGQTLPLAAGAYGDVVVQNAGTLELTGGTYELRSLQTGQHAVVRVDAPVTVKVEGILRIGDSSYIGPTNGSVAADEIVVDVGGSLVRFGAESQAMLYVFAPRATMLFGRNFIGIGQFVARNVNTDQSTHFMHPVCGNGIIEAGEQCDPPTPGVCDSHCRLIGSTTTTTSTTSTSTTKSTTSSTTTSTTTTTTSTSTTTITIVPPQFFEFTSTAGSGTCGTARDAQGTIVRTLDCAGLRIGNGQSAADENITPDGNITRMTVGPCEGTRCAIGPVATPSLPAYDCSDAGCTFGAPLPITTPLYLCVVNRFAAPVSGTLDVVAGTTDDFHFPLLSTVYFTNGYGVSSVCPVCSAAGTPANPGTGVCLHGARDGLPCHSTDSTGLTTDCPPGGTCDPGGSCSDGSILFGTIPVDLMPLTTGTATQTAADGLFCQDQLTTAPGCWHRPTCRTIEAHGTAAGSLVSGDAKPIGLGAVFCVPASDSQLLNGTGGLPGPAATSIVGTARVIY
jgi:hypothetical protein